MNGCTKEVGQEILICGVYRIGEKRKKSISLFSTCNHLLSASSPCHAQATQSYLRFKSQDGIPRYLVTAPSRAQGTGSLELLMIFVPERLRMSKIIFVIQLQTIPEILNQREPTRISGRMNKVKKCVEFNVIWILTTLFVFECFVFFPPIYCQKA